MILHCKAKLGRGQPGHIESKLLAGSGNCILLIALFFVLLVGLKIYFGDIHYETVFTRLKTEITQTIHQNLLIITAEVMIYC